MDESLGSVGILLMGLGAAFYLLAGGCVIEPFEFYIAARRFSTASNSKAKKGTKKRNKRRVMQQGGDLLGKKLSAGPVPNKTISH